MDKGISKEFFKSYGVPCPQGFSLSVEEADAPRQPLAYPCVVKPACGGSSIGVSIVHNETEYKKALADAFVWEDQVVIEDYIQGREFSVGVIEGKALPVIEIAPIQGFYDYKNKYAAGSAVETCPADLPADITAQMHAMPKWLWKPWAWRPIPVWTFYSMRRIRSSVWRQIHCQA